MTGKVGIVIVSHSPDVARGTADMVRQMVGRDVPLSFCSGNPDGGLGTSVEKGVGEFRSGPEEAGNGYEEAMDALLAICQVTEPPGIGRDHDRSSTGWKNNTASTTPSSRRRASVTRRKLGLAATRRSP